MLTCKSPRKVMRVAHALASRSLPTYSNKFSRQDFTLPQLFACPVVKEMLRRSYRGAEMLLRDCPHWLRDVGLRRTPDHNTLSPGREAAAGQAARRQAVGRGRAVGGAGAGPAAERQAAGAGQQRLGAAA